MKAVCFSNNVRKNFTSCLGFHGNELLVTGYVRKQMRKIDLKWHVDVTKFIIQYFDTTGDCRRVSPISTLLVPSIFFSPPSTLFECIIVILYMYRSLYDQILCLGSHIVAMVCMLL